MRRAAFLAMCFLVALAGTASAKRVVMTPTIPRSCPGGESWDVVAKCLAKYGQVTLEKNLPGAQLVRLGGTVSGYRVPGFYLYVQRGKRWQLGGMFEGATEYTLFKLENVKLPRAAGYRFDIGTTEDAAISFDGETSLPAQQQQKLAVFCSGNGYACEAIVMSCDLLFGGKSYYSFRGKLEYGRDEVVVHGDRRNTGTACQQVEHVPLGWSDG